MYGQSNLNLAGMKKTDTMKMRRYLIILAVFLLAMLTVQPALSADTITSVIDQVAGINVTKTVINNTLDLEQDAASKFITYGQQSLTQNDYTGAIAFYDRALAENLTLARKTDALLYLYQGKAYAQIKLGNYSGAITTLDEGLTQYPKDALLWNNKGQAFKELGKTQDALAAYDNAVSLDRNYTLAYVNRGILLTQMGRYSEAVEAFSRANETEPFNEDILNWLETARQGESESSRTMTILLGIVIIAAACIVVWYVRFRRPAEPAPEEKKVKSRKK